MQTGPLPPRRFSRPLRRVLEDPLNEPRRSIGPRLLQWLVAAAISLGVFAWISWSSLIRSGERSRPPEPPALHPLVPADFMTPSEGTVRPPTLRSADGDAALRAGDAGAAAAAYADALRADSRDRYAALLAACVAIERDDFAGATAPLATAAAGEEPLRCTLASVRLLARMLERRSRHAEAPLADLYLEALAREVDDESPAAMRGPDPFHALYRERLLAPRTAPLDRERLAPAERALLELVLGEAALDVANAHVEHPDRAVQLVALERMRGSLADGTGRMLEALRRLSASEPDNAYYEFLLAAVLAPDALALQPTPEAPVPTFATEDEPDELPALPADALEALEEACRRPRLDPHLREVLALEESLRRAAGDAFAALHVTPPRERLFLGDPNLAGRIRYRALVAERRQDAREKQALLLAAVVLGRFEGALAHDPFRVEDPFVHRDAARTLIARSDELRLDPQPLRRRLDEYEPLTVAGDRVAAVRARLESPLPIPRLVRELFARYAADRSALVAALQRRIDAR